MDKTTPPWKIPSDFKIFCTEPFTITNTITRYILIVTNQPNYMEQSRLTSLKILKTVKDQIKFWPIIDQTGTYTNSNVQVISQYLKPLCKN